jgi:superfamily II DNA or RNA helicase
MTIVRDYSFQDGAVDAVNEHFADGAKSVLLVSPTGSGKTTMLERLFGNRRVLFVAHTQDIVYQSSDQFAKAFGRSNVGIVMSGEHPRPNARVQVATV